MRLRIMLGVVTAALLVANTVVANSLWEWSEEEYFWSTVVGPDKARAIYGMLKREFQGSSSTNRSSVVVASLRDDSTVMADLESRRLLSIVVPCYNEEEVLPLLREALIDVAGKLGADFDVEIVFVDDGSTDATWEQIRAFAVSDERVRGIALSRNFGHQMALTCAYDMARGDAIVCLDADLQDPPEVILELAKRWQDGADVVFAIRKSRAGETRFKLWTAALFYRMIRAVSATDVRRDTGDFRLMSRRALNALNALREHHRFIRGMVGWLGFETANVHYERRPRAAGGTKWYLHKMLRFAVDATVSISIFPLRLTFLFAGLLSLIVLSYVGFVVIRYFFFDVQLVPGWTSLLMSIMAFGAINLVCMGIMGEYVGRLYEQAKRRPLYLIREETAAPSAERESK